MWNYFRANSTQMERGYNIYEPVGYEYEPTGFNWTALCLNNVVHISF